MKVGLREYLYTIFTTSLHCINWVERRPVFISVMTDEPFNNHCKKCSLTMTDLYVAYVFADFLSN